MLDKDEGTEVPSASTNVGVTPQYFDGTKLLGDGLSRTSGISDTVWDVYMFYPAGTTWTTPDMPFPELAIAQQGGVVVGTNNSLPPVADQSRLLPELRGKLTVIGAQANFETLLQQVAETFAHGPAARTSAPAQ